MGGMGGVRGIFITLVNTVCLKVLPTRGRSNNPESVPMGAGRDSIQEPPVVFTGQLTMF